MDVIIISMPSLVRINVLEKDKSKDGEDAEAQLHLLYGSGSRRRMAVGFVTCSFFSRMVYHWHGVGELSGL